MANTYKVTPEKADQFTSILLMDYIINQGGELPIMMDGSFRPLEPLVIKLAAAAYVRTPATTETGKNYIATQKGRDALAKFMQRYSEYLKIFDVFCAVDLTEGTFAFERFFDFETDAEWTTYLNEDNWEDVRIAVAEYKKIDPLEIVFMSFLNENRFDFKSYMWQIDLSTGIIWDEMEKICNAALTVEQINQGDDTVMPDIIKQGAEITINLLKEEDERRKEEEESEPEPSAAASESEGVTTTTITEENYVQPYSYYEPYYQPYYVNPLWFGLLFLL